MKKLLICCMAGLMLAGFAGCNKTEQKNQPAPAANAQAPAANAQAPTDANPAVNAQAPAAPAAPQLVPAPDDVSAPPADAQKTDSGLAYKKLTQKDDGRAILPDDLVKIHYTGWTTNGAMFDSTTISGEPATFTPENLIPGMKEALTLFKVGEKARVWIPKELAYNDKPGAPAGMLVFDFDILDVVTPTMPPKEIPEDAIKLPDGIAYRIVKTTPGAKQITLNDLVSIDFAGWTQADSKRFHSSIEMGEQLTAPVNDLFPAWKEVLPNAHVGDVVQMWIPQELGIDPDGNQLKGMLIFEMTIQNAKALPQPPADLAPPPADVEKTASGIASKILVKGSGSEHPKADSRVRVHYTGWTTDGVMFDSSAVRGVPAEFKLTDVIPGWTEIVQLMVKGEKRLVWIPEELAYKGRPNAPQGMLIFEIELLDII